MRTKFKVDSVTEREEYCEIYLSTVYGYREDNKEFFKYTPSGNISVQLVRKEVAKQFIPGQEVYVDFTLISAD